MELFEKIKSRSLLWLIKAILKSIWKLIKTLSIFFELKRKRFTIQFPHEENLKIQLPIIIFSDMLFTKKRKLFNRCVDFSKRVNAEPLLRKLIFSMYQKNIIDSKKSIIDIGAWIGDNAIVWSKMIHSETGVVYAIDPSSKNIEFGRILASLNDSSNIRWICAVCSDVKDTELWYEGNIHHACFNDTGTGKKNSITTTTLDDIVSRDNWNSVGLIHMDVEGFELKVLKGAMNIIAQSKPVILFEQHISSEDSSVILKIIREKGYAIYMINEVLPGFNLDCRNFIAVNKDIDISNIVQIENSKGREEGVWYATLGGAVIPVNESY